MIQPISIRGLSPELLKVVLAVNDVISQINTEQQRNVYVTSVTGGGGGGAQFDGYIGGDTTVDGDFDVTGSIIPLVEHNAASDAHAAAFTAHKAESDPHPVYLTEAEGDTRYPGAPIGSLMLWPSPLPPEQYLMADGSAVPRAEYADLYDIVGTSYGAGDGSTTFNLPSPVAISVES